MYALGNKANYYRVHTILEKHVNEGDVIKNPIGKRTYYSHIRCPVKLVKIKPEASQKPQ